MNKATENSRNNKARDIISFIVLIFLLFIVPTIFVKSVKVKKEAIVATGWHYVPDFKISFATINGEELLLNITDLTDNEHANLARFGGLNNDEYLIRISKRTVVIGANTRISYTVELTKSEEYYINNSVGWLNV